MAAFPRAHQVSRQPFVLSVHKAFAVSGKADEPIIGGVPADSTPIEQRRILSNTSHKQPFLEPCLNSCPEPEDIRHMWVEEIRAVSSPALVTTEAGIGKVFPDLILT